jgi:hypothetical protein
MNIKTIYRIPVLLNNKKTLLQRTIKTKSSHKEHYKQYRSQGTIQKYQLQGKIQKNNNHKETGNNRRNTNQKEQCKYATIQEITIPRNNSKIQLTRNNRRNNNHKEQCQDTTYREQCINKT